MLHRYCRYYADFGVCSYTRWLEKYTRDTRSLASCMYRVFFRAHRVCIKIHDTRYTIHDTRRFRVSCIQPCTQCTLYGSKWISLFTWYHEFLINDQISIEFVSGSLVYSVQSLRLETELSAHTWAAAEEACWNKRVARDQHASALMSLHYSLSQTRRHLGRSSGSTQSAPAGRSLFGAGVWSLRTHE